MTMQLPKSIRDNLRFLTIEVDSQIANLQTFFKTPTAAIARRILDRSGYAYNLKMRIHTSCVKRLADCKKCGNTETLALRGVEFIATDLERITELSYAAGARQEGRQRRDTRPAGDRSCRHRPGTDRGVMP